MNKTLIALAAAGAFAAASLAVAPAAAAPLAPAQLGVAIHQTVHGVQLASHNKKKYVKHKWSHNKKHGKYKPYRHAGRYWRFVGPYGYYPGCFQVPGGFYCTY